MITALLQYNKDTSGFGFSIQGSSPARLIVDVNGSASSAGLKTDDSLLAIDGAKVEKLDHLKIAAILHKAIKKETRDETSQEKSRPTNHYEKSSHRSFSSLGSRGRSIFKKAVDSSTETLDLRGRASKLKRRLSTLYETSSPAKSPCLAYGKSFFPKASIYENGADCSVSTSNLRDFLYKGTAKTPKQHSSSLILRTPKSRSKLPCELESNYFDLGSKKSNISRSELDFYSDADFICSYVVNFVGVLQISDHVAKMSLGASFLIDKGLALFDLNDKIEERRSILNLLHDRITIQFLDGDCRPSETTLYYAAIVDLGTSQKDKKETLGIMVRENKSNDAGTILNAYILRAISSEFAKHENHRSYALDNGLICRKGFASFEKPFGASSLCSQFVTNISELFSALNQAIVSSNAYTIYDKGSISNRGDSHQQIDEQSQTVANFLRRYTSHGRIFENSQDFPTEKKVKPFNLIDF